MRRLSGEIEAFVLVAVAAAALFVFVEGAIENNVLMSVGGLAAYLAAWGYAFVRAGHTGADPV